MALPGFGCSSQKGHRKPAAEAAPLPIRRDLQSMAAVFAPCCRIIPLPWQAGLSQARRRTLLLALRQRVLQSQKILLRSQVAQFRITHQVQTVLWLWLGQRAHLPSQQVSRRRTYCLMAETVAIVQRILQMKLVVAELILWMRRCYFCQQHFSFVVALNW